MSGTSTIKNKPREVSKEAKTVSGLRSEDTKPGLVRKLMNGINRGVDVVAKITSKYPGPSAMVTSVLLFAGLNWFYISSTILETTSPLGILVLLACAGVEVFSMILFGSGVVKTIIDINQWAEDSQKQNNSQPA